ncbi:sodium-dependent dicarboxylate transporter 2/3/5 [Desulfosalsimonas propionicica]|uniref:Sodium-dependent dicarboxylate transporter 2/3/5 n=1 Tax=Desulfosalsimonas propionicica TaxID=332175 RepID=A0A7W0HJ52_9BACT|nr:SLC13 family permease [Desulfosalsimonas propionicica]MBA2879815.1 sodium-dependent dicarboxylate transporter 2/3/5 [Desulfosalsimonas propionicica]
MSHEIDTGGQGGILANKTLWLIVGIAFFVVVGFILPTPESLVETIDKHGIASKMIDWGIAENLDQAADKAMTVLGIIPMAIIFFATEAIPIGLTGILMPLLAYFLGLLPRGMIGKTFAGDAPLFLLGVLAMGVAVVDVGLHKRLATWILGWTKGFYTPIFVLCISMAIIGSFISAHAMCAFMTPVMMAVYFGVVSEKSTGGRIEHDPNLAKFLLFALCFALNVGGVGSPAAGGRNVIMMGFWQGYDVPMDFFTWMTYGFPMVPVLGLIVAVYMIVLFSGKIKHKDLTPGLVAMKEETRKMGKMKYAEYVTFAMLIVILGLWIFADLGLGGPALLALIIPVIFRTTAWNKILGGISWDAWFMYCGALTLGALLKETGAALWLAQSVMGILSYAGMSQGFGLWVGLSAFSGLMTNFMSDAGTTALLGPIVIPMGIMSEVAGEPWASGMAVAFATSFAHFLIVGTPNNAIVYGLGTYPDTGERAIAPIDFVKYGFALWVICLVVVWVLAFGVMFKVVGFPPDVLETATQVFESGAADLSKAAEGAAH